MKTRDLGLFGIGLILGLVVSIVILSSSADLQQSLFGTAGLTPAAEPAFVLADMDATRNWLVEMYPDEEASLTTAFTNVTPLTDPEANFRDVILATQSDVDLIVNRAYTALTGTEPAALPTGIPALDTARIPQPLLPSLADGNVGTCLGIDENPYSVEGYVMYLYVEVPVTQIDVLPTVWERLDEPKDDDLYWQRLACQSLTAETTPQRR